MNASPETAVTRRVRVADPDLVWLRSVLEAYDGLVQWSGDGSGVLSLSVSSGQARELDALLEDLAREISLHVLR